MFCRHDDCVQYNTERDEQVKERLRGDQVEDVLKFQPRHKQSAFTTVVAAHTVPVDNLSLFGGHLPVFFHC